MEHDEDGDDIGGGAYVRESGISSGQTNASVLPPDVDVGDEDEFTVALEDLRLAGKDEKAEREAVAGAAAAATVSEENEHDPNAERLASTDFEPISLESADVTRAPGEDAALADKSKRTSLASRNGTSTDPTAPASQSTPRTSAAKTSTSPHTPSPSRKGTSKLEEVLSRTRQTTLPPKAKDEDKKHITEWEKMMRQSKELEREKMHRREESRLKKDAEHDNNITVWEQAILPNFKDAIRDKRLRRMWWYGIPSKLRARVWTTCVGNPLMISSKTFLEVARTVETKLQEQDSSTLDRRLEVEHAVGEVFPEMRVLQQGGPLHEDLILLVLTLLAYRIRPLHLSAVTWLSAVTLLNTSSAQSFTLLTNLLNNGVMQAFVNDQQEEIGAYLRVFGTLFADALPKLFHHFATVNFSIDPFVSDWFLCLYVRYLPIDCSMRIWDLLFLEGDSILFRTAISILANLESRCYGDHDEIQAVLNGEDRGATRAVLDPTPSSPWSDRSSHRSGDRAARDGIYSVYGINAEGIVHALEKEEWKESNFRRILARELP